MNIQVLRTVLKQAQELAQEKMEGISVILNDADMTDIQVDIFFEVCLVCMFIFSGLKFMFDHSYICVF